jgi:glycine cleavage system H lipoate-binding protein/ABC-type phosphate transport system substrate-binding protein
MRSKNINSLKMKRISIFVISLLLINYSSIYCKGSTKGIDSSLFDSLRILSSPDLFNLSAKWVAEYKKINPESGIRIISVPDEKIADKLASEGNIGFVTNEYYSGLKSQSFWKVVVGRDVIVPVINSKNPLIEEINRKGVSPEALAEFFNYSDSRSWGKLIDVNQNSPVDFYYFKDQSIQSGLMDFLKTGNIKIRGKEVNNAEEMIAAIQKDPYALGFCKMINIFDLENREMAENISLLPIDRNSNGIIDNNEKIYDDPSAFSRGVYIGKYPKTLISNIYTVSLAQPENLSVVAFLKWVLTDGQKYLFNNGFSDLLLSERQTTVDKLNRSKVYTTTVASDNSLPKIALIILASIIILGFIIDISVRFARRRKAVMLNEGNNSHLFLNENSLLLPKGLYYDKTHTWAFMDQNGIVKVGVDDFLQHITGPITRIKMISPGKKIKKGEQIMSLIQNGKQLNLYAPVSGTIVEQNKIVDTNSSIINSSPYTEGWVYKIEPDNWNRENQLLFMAEKQKEHIKNEFSRLRDFLAMALNLDKVQFDMTVLQDGGELNEGVLSDFGPEVWEDFQTNFIDPSRQLWFYEIS